MTRIKRIGWWLLKAAIVLLVAFYAAAGAATLWFGRQLESRINEIARRGEPISLGDFVSGIEGPNAGRLESALKELTGLKVSRKASEAVADIAGRWEPRPEAGVWQEAHSALSRMDSALDDVAEATQDGDISMGFSAPPWGEKSLAGMTELRGAVRGLASRAVVRARDGDRAGAVADLEAAARTASAASPRGALIGALVRIACVSLACSGIRNSMEFVTLSDEEEARLCRALDGAIPDDLLSQAMLYERACGHLMFAAMRDGQMDEQGAVRPHPKQPGLLRKFETLPLRAMLYANEVVYLDAITRNSELLRKPYRELAGGKLEQEILDGMPRWATLTRMLVPVFARAQAAADRGRATVGATRALLALERYKAANGAYPAALDLARTSTCEFGGDPFSGKPFVYRRQGDGFLLYSIGDDLKDNGGKAGGEHHRNDPGTDLVWTMAR